MVGPPLPEIVRTPGGESLHLGGRWLLSSREPLRRCEEVAAAFDPLERSLILCPSPLLGYGLDSLLTRLPPSSLLLCVEAESSLLEMTRDRLAPDLLSHPRLRLLSLKELEEAFNDIVESELPFRRLQYLELTGGAGLHADVYAHLRIALEEGIRARWMNRATLWRMGKLWIRNLLKNLPALPDALCPEELFSGAAAKALLVAGAGPSLEEALPWMGAHRGELFILAVDTALQPLIDAGIRPDAAICLEAQVHNLADFIGLSASGIPLVADMVSHPASLRALSGPFCPLSSDFADLGLLRRLRAAGILPPPFPPLGSVGVAACAFALDYGPAEAPLFLSGLDFSYLPGKTHARGSLHLRSALSRSLRSLPDPHWAASMGTRSRVLDAVMGTGGLPARGDSVLSGYAEHCKRVLEPHRTRCFDLRTGGVDLGLRRVDSSEAEAILKQARAAATIPAVPRWRPPPPSLIHEALGAELSRLLRLREGLAGARSMEASELQALLGDCDYLYCHFPDAEAGARLDLDFLKRVAMEAEGMRARVERAISLTGA